MGNKDGIFEYGCNHKLSALEEDYSSSLFFLSAIKEGRIERVSATARQDTKNFGGEEMAPQEMGERPGREKRTEEHFPLPSRRLLGTPF